jgi:capsule polysaccharide modification protein KpsS
MILWQEKLNHHQCSVEQIQSYVGKLQIKRGNKIVYETPVDIDFNADQYNNKDDINEWKEFCKKFMENNKIPSLMIV